MDNALVRNHTRALYSIHPCLECITYSTSDMHGLVCGELELSEGFRDGIDHACMILTDTSLVFVDLDVLSMRSGSESGLSLFITFMLTLA